MLSNDVNKTYKFALDTYVDGGFCGQTAFGTESLADDGTEVTFHKWCGRKGGGSDIYAVNNGIYAASGMGSKINLTLLRTPVYSAHPIEERQIVPHDRMSEHIDMGERELDFRITAEKAIDKEAEIFNMPPLVMSFFPAGGGEKIDFGVSLDNDTVLITTMQKRENGILIRLYNALDTENSTVVTTSGGQFNVMLNPFEVKTYILKDNNLIETNMLG